MAAQETSYSRFSIAQRLEHWVMTFSFTVLVITGLPQRYALSNWAEFTITSLGGIEGHPYHSPLGSNRLYGGDGLPLHRCGL